MAMFSSSPHKKAVWKGRASQEFLNSPARPCMSQLQLTPGAEACGPSKGFSKVDRGRTPLILSFRDCQRIKPSPIELKEE